MRFDATRDGGGRDSRDPRGRVARLAAISLVATLLLIAAGGYTRGSGSGYGCRDRWPLCENGALGGLLPRADSHMIVEWTHRWLASLIGVLVLLTAIMARRARVATLPAVAAIVMVGIQAYLGRLVVTNDLDADLVSLHLAIALTVASLLALTLSLALPDERFRDTPTAPPRWFAELGATAALTALALLLGSLVHNRYVGGWPLVEGGLLPDLSTNTEQLHYLHRIAAGIGTVAVGYVAVLARRRGRPRTERALVDTALACYLGNIVLGAAHVVTEVRSSLVVMAHLLLASIAWTALVLAIFLARRATLTSSEAPARLRSEQPVA